MQNQLTIAQNKRTLPVLKSVAELETKNSNHQIFAKGKYIYSDVDYSNKIYFIIAGRIKIEYFPEPNRKITLAILKEGEFFGEQSLAGISRRKDFAQAIENTTIRVISMHEMTREKLMVLKVMCFKLIKKL